MSELFFYAFFLGALFNVAPGAVLAESLRQGIKGGFMPAMAVQIGSLVGDGLWVVLGLLGVAALITIPAVILPLMIFGALLLGWLAWQSLMDSMEPMPALDATASMNESKSSMAVGVALSISNPLNIIYWAALGGTIAAFTAQTPRVQDFIVFIIGFMLSSVLWCFIASGMIAFCRSVVTPGLWRYLHLGCGTGLLLLMVFVVNNIIEIVYGHTLLPF
jgi:threonine/homoserine/homoserine lactone efflux protein